MMVVKNRRTLDGFKQMYSTADLHKQTDRKWELANAHEMRFESIDRDTTALSSNKRCFSYVSLDKTRDRDFSYLVNKNTVFADYQINEKLVTRKYGGCVSLEKQSRRWEQDPYGSLKIKNSMLAQSAPGLETYDQVKAFEQKIKLKVKPNVAGLVSLDKQSSRNLILKSKTTDSKD